MRPETVNNFSLQLFHMKGKLIEMFYEFVEKAAIAAFQLRSENSHYENVFIEMIHW